VRSLVHLGDDVSLVLLGEGPVRNQLEGIAIESGVSSRVFFHPFVPHASVPAFISSADIGIVPYEHVGLNHYLCSPSKLFHYIMAELTVVCSDFPFLREVVLGNGIGATFDPSSPASIAASIRRAIELRATDQGLADRLASIKRRYCWEQEEQSFLDVYRSLARTDNPAFP
jgi:glycosyltransferase involved in cell wall biosynthesis